MRGPPRRAPAVAAGDDRLSPGVAAPGDDGLSPGAVAPSDDRLSLGPAAPGDAAALGAILSDWIDETAWMPRLHSREEDAAFVAHLIGTCDVRVLRGSGAQAWGDRRDGPARALVPGPGAAADGPAMPAGSAAQGFIALREGTVVALYLAPGARGRGGGTALLRAAMRDRRRLELWTFAANAGALAFYRRAGFAEVETTDGARNEEGLPDVRLVWTATEERA